MLIDTHFHLPNDISKLEKQIASAKNNNVKYFILGGIAPKENVEMIEIAKANKEIFLTLGYHPEYANDITEKDLEILEEQIKNNHPIAIGEIGLDYHYDNNSKQQQKELFNKQLLLAEKYKLPVVIHSRDATQDTYDILKKHSVKGVLHCYSGSLEIANKYIDLGYKLGIGGVLTFKNSNLKEVVSKIPLENIMLETDSPYLSPNRGEENEPKNIYVIADCLANITGKTMQEIAKITTNNAIKLFDLNI